MFNRTTRTALAKSRLQEARILHKNKKYDGSVYLAGYAVEIGLKLEICRVLNWHGFPYTRSEFDDLNSFKTHKLHILLKFTGLEASLRKDTKLYANWIIITGWDPEIRYKPIGIVSKEESINTIKAAATLLKYFRV